MTSECGMDGIAARHDEWTIVLKFQFFYFLFGLPGFYFRSPGTFSDVAPHPPFVCLGEPLGEKRGGTEEREREGGKGGGLT